MLKKMFHTFADACGVLGVDEEAMRQIIAQGGVNAFLHLQGAPAILLMLSFENGVTPSSGRNGSARWLRKDKRTPDEDGGIYELTGWFQIEPTTLRDAALFGAFLETIDVIPPPECDGLHDGDIWQLSELVENEYDGSVWTGRQSSIELPTLRKLWFSHDQLEAMKGSGTGVLSATATQDKPVATRTKNNLLRVIAALSKEAKVALGTESQTTQVRLLLDKAGFKKPDDKTLREFLTEAASLEPDA